MRTRSWYVLVLVVYCCYARMDTQAHRIANIRREQWKDTIAEYVDHEREVEQIKHDNGVSYEQSVWHTIFLYAHAVPWCVWQILAIVTACLLGVFLPMAWNGRYIPLAICMGVLCSMITYVVWSGCYASCPAIACCHTSMHVGPSHVYPVVGDIQHLDEVEVLQRLEDWVKVRYTNQHGWIPTACIICASDDDR